MMMMMQVNNFFSVLSLMLMVIGIILVVYGLWLHFAQSQGDVVEHESKGFILLGPIPIVWGYGWKGWVLALLIGMILFSLFFLFPF
ncbi:MAG: TIGR00304 family membrane protein [Candidatus Thorarchaeota archaeon]